MAKAIDKLPAVNPETGRLNVVVDTPKGCRNKYKLDEKNGCWRLSKILPQGISFPYDFGFLPSTRGEDGDAVDVLLIMDEPTFPGCIVPARLIGVVEAEQTEKGKTIRNDRLIAVVETPYNPAEYQTLEDIGQQRLNEIEHFFVSYNEMEGRKLKIMGRKGAAFANKLLGKLSRKDNLKRGVRQSHRRDKKK